MFEHVVQPLDRKRHDGVLILSAPEQEFALQAFEPAIPDVVDEKPRFSLARDLPDQGRERIGILNVVRTAEDVAHHLNCRAFEHHDVFDEHLPIEHSEQHVDIGLCSFAPRQWPIVDDNADVEAMAVRIGRAALLGSKRHRRKHRYQENQHAQTAANRFRPKVRQHPPGIIAQ